MTNILLRCANHFGHHLKVVLLNENKRIINTTATRCNKIFIVLTRSNTTTSRYEQNNEKNLINEKFDNIYRHLEIHNSIERAALTSIIYLMHSADVMNTIQTVLLLKWCNNVENCLPVERVKLGESLWLQLSICNFQMSTAHYNALLKLYVENEYDFSPLKLLEEMTYKKIHPDTVTYETCIQYYCMKGNVPEALMLMKSMLRLPNLTTESVFNSLILGYSQSGDIKNVNDVLSKMVEQKLQLTSETMTAVMCTYAKLNNVNKIEEIIKNCNLNNIFFTNKDILNIIYILTSNNHTDNINKMYQYLIKSKTISFKDIQIILKIIDTDQIHIVANILFHMSLDNKHNQFEDVLYLILKHKIKKSTTINDILKLCILVKDDDTFKKFLSMSVYHTLIKNSDLSLPLLRICKSYIPIRPHYFWPLLIRQANKYDLQGILDIIEIMINEFHTMPCIDTITDFVLPLTFQEVSSARNLLVKYKISEIMFNNAYVLLMLKKKRVAEAAVFMRYSHSKYFYKVIAHHLRRASAAKHDVHDFIYISSNLLEIADSYAALTSNDIPDNATRVSLDKQLCDFMLDFPFHKLWLIRVIQYLSKQKIKLNTETVKIIRTFLQDYDVQRVLQSVSNIPNSTNNVQHNLLYDTLYNSEDINQTKRHKFV